MNADQRIAEWLSDEASFDQDGPDPDEPDEGEGLADGAFEGPDGPDARFRGVEPGPRRARPIERVWHRPASVGLEGPQARLLELLDAVARRIRKKPMSALAIALGAGFVVGGALSSRVGRAMLAAGARHVARELLKQLL
jgi:hypothetical protein